MNDKQQKIYNALTSELGSSEIDLLDELIASFKDDDLVDTINKNINS